MKNIIKLLLIFISIVFVSGCNNLSPKPEIEKKGLVMDLDEGNTNSNANISTGKFEFTVKDKEESKK